MNILDRIMKARASFIQADYADNMDALLKLFLNAKYNANKPENDNEDTDLQQIENISQKLEHKKKKKNMLNLMNKIKQELNDDDTETDTGHKSGSLLQEVKE